MLTWAAPQQAAIERAFRDFPPESNDCALAARAVLKVAAQVDAEARALVIEPEGFALYVQPKGGPSDWLHHVTTAVSRHYLDVLTGVGGHPQPTYLSTYFEHPESLTIRPVDESEWGEL